jgi:hypothetical protein
VGVTVSNTSGSLCSAAALVGYAKSDLVVPACHGWGSLAEANAAARAWCAEVNARVHSEIAAVPAVRLAKELACLRPLPSLRAAIQRGEQRKVDRLATLRFGSARYSVPARLVGERVWVSVAAERVLIDHREARVAEHPLIAPGEVSIIDEHYGGAATPPRRALRARTASERAFLALGPAAEAFLRVAAAAGQTRLPAHLGEIVALEAAHGREALVAALERACTFRRFTADDVRAILAAGPHAPTPAAAGEPLGLGVPDAPQRGLDAYGLDRLTRPTSRRSPSAGGGGPGTSSRRSAASCSASPSGKGRPRRADGRRPGVAGWWPRALAGRTNCETPLSGDPKIAKTTRARGSGHKWHPGAIAAGSCSNA